jgi:polyisoprenoid-binding protein YceI
MFVPFPKSWRGELKRWTVQSTSIVLLLCLVGCTAGRPVAADRNAAAGAAAATARLTPPADARIFDIVASESLVQIKVWREGALASAGHNHLIALRDLRGKVWLAKDLARSVVQLEFDVAALSVDEPELRAAAGADFPRDVPDSARNGTRDNLRGPGVLDAAAFPQLRLTASLAGTQAPQQLRLLATLSIKGKDVALQIPLRLEQDGATLIASGELPLRQTDLGLTPFSVMLGALRVRDEMQIAYRIVARAAGR